MLIAEADLDLQRRNPQTLSDEACHVLRSDLSAEIPQAPPHSPASYPPILSLQAISKSWGRHQVLKGIDLIVQQGEVIAIIGPSGSGKTTLIRTINALESIDSGAISLFGENYLTSGTQQNKARIRASVRRIGMVFQGFHLFPHRTVLDNITLAPRYHKLLDKAVSVSCARRLLDRVGLLAHADKYPPQHSIQNGSARY